MLPESQSSPVIKRLMFRLSLWRKWSLGSNILPSFRPYICLSYFPQTLFNQERKKYAISYNLLVHTEVSTVGDDTENQDSSNLDGLFQTLKLNTT